MTNFDRRRPFGPWLHRIVVNRAIDWTRSRSLRHEVGVETTDAVAAREGRHFLAGGSVRNRPREINVRRWRPLAHGSVGKPGVAARSSVRTDALFQRRCVVAPELRAQPVPVCDRLGQRIFELNEERRGLSRIAALVLKP